jgi:hemerythrin-like domain-containing protein
MDDLGTQAQRDLRALLREDHDRLDDLFEQVLSVFEADARDEAVRLWTDFERGLQAHFELEERYILPELAKVDAAEVSELTRDHARVRAKLGELGVGVDLHLTRNEAVADFIATLRAHVGREDALMYRFAQTSLPERTQAVLRARLPAARLL